MNNKKLMKVLGLLAVVALVAALLPVSPVKAAATICVGPTTEGCKPTITEAVSAASAGDTIYIKAGTYNENISTSKQLNIIGEVDEAGEPLVEIGGRLNFDLPSAPFAWRIENINFVVGTTYNSILRLRNANGLTIKNSTFDGAGNYHVTPRKTGIELRSGTNNVTIENSLFTNGLFNAISGEVDSLLVKNSTIEDVNNGVVISGSSGNLVTIENTDISVIATSGSIYSIAIHFGGNSSDLTVTGSRIFIDDQVPASGWLYHGAIRIGLGVNGTLTVENNTILGNVRSFSSSTLDASPNWWGNTDGPDGAGFEIEGLVDYEPWLSLFINLDHKRIDENLPSGTLVGELSVESPDEDNVYTYVLVNDDETCPGPDNSSFQIEENRLLSAETYNFEAKHRYVVCIGAIDPWEHQVDQQFIVRINDVNDAPVLVEPIVFDNVVDEHVSISFTVAATDEDENPSADTLSWKLIGAPTGATILPASGLGLNATVSWIPDEGQGPDEYTFTVQVCDNDYDNEPPLQHILCDEALVTIIVNEVNEAPVAHDDFYLGSSEPTVVEAPGVLLNDVDNDFPKNDLTVYLTQDIPAGEGTLDLNSDGSFEYMPPTVPPADGETEFKYKVFDGALYSNEAIVTIKFNDTRPADISLIPLSAQENTIYSGTLATHGDLDSGDKWTYALVPGDGDADNNLFKVVEEPVGVFKIESKDKLNYEYQEAYNIRVRSTDKYGAWYERPFTIRAIDQNDAPVLESIGNKTVNELEELTFTAIATDEDVPADELTFSLALGAPAATGARINPTTGEFWWAPSEEQGPGNYPITIIVSDGTVSVSETIRVTVNEVNQAPVLDPIGNHIIDEEETLTFTATANDADRPRQGLRFHLSSDDRFNYGATLNIRGDFEWTPSELQGPGDYQFEICVGDRIAEDCETITVTVNEVNKAPVAADDDYRVIANQTLVVGAPGVLANDTDADRPLNTLKAVLQTNVPAGEGTLSFHDDGSFEYIPPVTPPTGNLTSFEYKAFDGLAYSDIVTVTLRIRYENSAPTGITLPLSIPENVLYEGTLTSLDSDLPNEAFTYELVSGPGDDDNAIFHIGGVNGDELIASAPFNYEEKLSYNVRIRTTDLFGESYEAPFIISVDDANDAPEAFDQSVTTLENEAVEIELGGFDEDGDALDFAIFNEPQHGTVTGNEVGGLITTEAGILRLISQSVTYTPDEGFVGEDSFTYKTRDEEGAISELATVTIIVNDVPEALDDEYAGTEDTLLVVAAPGVLGNDINEEEVAALTAQLVSDVSHGELSLSSNGSFTYMPDENFFGEDSFTYKACEGSLCSEPAEVTLTIAPINDAPVADDVVAETAEDTAVSITLDVSDVEGDDLVASIVTPPAHGVAVVSGTVVIYTPEADWNGLDEFTYKVNDGALDSNVAVISVNVTPVNDAPVAEDVEAETDEDTAVAITLLASDVDGDELTFTVVTQPAHGMLSGTAPALTYTPETDFNGTDSFTFKANDGSLDSNIATVTISVGAVNDEPNAVDDEYDAWMGVTLEVPAPGVLANDFDPDPSDEQTVEVKDAPLHGELVLNPDGSFTYEPDAGFHGIDTFTYWLISEPGVQSAYMDSATVTITVRPVARIFLPIILK
jgi:VCBS repeat-containing protein